MKWLRQKTLECSGSPGNGMDSSYLAEYSQVSLEGLNRLIVTMTIKCGDYGRKMVNKSLQSGPRVRCKF